MAQDEFAGLTRNVQRRPWLETIFEMIDGFIEEYRLGAVDKCFCWLITSVRLATYTKGPYMSLVIGSDIKNEMIDPWIVCK